MRIQRLSGTLMQDGSDELQAVGERACLIDAAARSHADAQRTGNNHGTNSHPPPHDLSLSLCGDISALTG